MFLQKDFQIKNGTLHIFLQLLVGILKAKVGIENSDTSRGEAHINPNSQSSTVSQVFQSNILRVSSSPVRTGRFAEMIAWIFLFPYYRNRSYAVISDLLRKSFQMAEPGWSDVYLLGLGSVGRSRCVPDRYQLNEQQDPQTHCLFLSPPILISMFVALCIPVIFPRFGQFGRMQLLWC